MPETLRLNIQKVKYLLANTLPRGIKKCYDSKGIPRFSVFGLKKCSLEEIKGQKIEKGPIGASK